METPIAMQNSTIRIHPTETNRKVERVIEIQRRETE